MESIVTLRFDGAQGRRLILVPKLIPARSRGGELRERILQQAGALLGSDFRADDFAGQFDGQIGAMLRQLIHCRIRRGANVVNRPLVLGLGLWREKSVPEVLNQVLAPWGIRDPVTDGEYGEGF